LGHIKSYSNSPTETGPVRNPGPDDKPLACPWKALLVISAVEALDPNGVCCPSRDHIFSSKEYSMEHEKRKSPPTCASCEVEGRNRICFTEKGLTSKGCPTIAQKEVLEEAAREYEIPEIREFARQASVQEGECYADRDKGLHAMHATKPRIVEICEFAKKMGYQRLGLAFCAGLMNEAAIFEKILVKQGLEVISVMCKAGRAPKEGIGIKDKEKVFPGTQESMCNPIFQAKLLNHEKTQFNILLGLCVGHDSLFLKYSEAFATVLAVKDRVTGHNPLAPLYLSSSYYRRLMG
jgi:uncharacterized metal-binding protein